MTRGLRLCIVGGIFDKPDAYRARHALTPETILVQGLRDRGYEVDAVGHNQLAACGRYDLVHVHHFGRAALMMAARNTRAPFVFTGHSGPLTFGHERSLLRRGAFRQVLRSADALVALSEAEAGRLARLAGRRAPVHVIPNGIPADLFHPEEGARPRPGGPAVILFVGQLVKLKGVDVLLPALQQLARRRDAVLWLAYQNAALEAHCRRLCSDLGIADRVQFLGLRSAPELAQLYREADVVALPSYAEALPSVISEALLSGKPVVATRVGGIPEQVGPYGQLVAPGDPIALAGALQAVLDDLPRYRALAPEMSAYAQGRFSVQAMVGSHLQLYEAAVACSRARRGGLSVLSRWLLSAAIDLYWSAGRYRKLARSGVIAERVVRERFGPSPQP